MSNKTHPESSGSESRDALGLGTVCGDCVWGECVRGGLVSSSATLYASDTFNRNTTSGYHDGMNATSRYEDHRPKIPSAAFTLYAI